MAQTKSRSTGSASPRRRTSTARGGNSNAPRATRQAQTPATSSGPAGDGGGSAIGRAALPLATAAAGTIAGVLVGRRRRGRQRKVLGVSIPGTGGGGVDALAKSIGEAGKQLSKLADEVRTGREKAEQIGKALS
jgi:hypothetical protein